MVLKSDGIFSENFRALPLSASFSKPSHLDLLFCLHMRLASVLNSRYLSHFARVVVDRNIFSIPPRISCFYDPSENQKFYLQLYIGTLKCRHRNVGRVENHLGFLCD